MKKLMMLVFVVSVFFASKAYSQYFCEDFEYTPGDSITNHGWITISGFGENPIIVVEPGLEHFCYGSVFGNAVRLTTTGEDSYLFFPRFSNSGTVYLLFMVKFLGAQTGDFFLHLGDSVVNNSNKIARIYAKTDGGNIAIGLAKNNETPVYTPGNYVIGEVYIVVLKYEFLTATSHDDLVSLFTFAPDDCPPIIEPLPTLGPLGNGENDLPNIGKVVLQQGADSKAPDLIIDGICMDFVWDNGALPVELTTFTSTVSDNNVTLNWSTSGEKNNYGFFVERRSGSADWNSAGFAEGYGSTVFAHEYTFTDRNLSTGRYSYRLKQTDYNGNYSYYYLAGDVAVGVPSVYELSQNYPNPFNPSTDISFAIPYNGVVSMKVFDNLGREVKTLVNEFRNAGYYSVTFDAGDLSSGVYYCRIESGGFAKTIRMALLK